MNIPLCIWPAFGLKPGDRCSGNECSFGETERNLRKALDTAEVMAPCVLWLDEIEKGLAAGNDDDGLSRRVLGTLLTWMSERPKPVFIVATANDITRLPPEMVRKGRFDEIFFVDLPSPSNRRDILAIHLRKRCLDPAQFDLAALSAATETASRAPRSSRRLSPPCTPPMPKGARCPKPTCWRK